MKITEGDLQRGSNNIDGLRLIAASFVLIGHASPILLNKDLEWDPFLALFGINIQTAGVLIFFIISGFLVARSWELKKNILAFFIARVLRIFPALVCVVLLSVFILGVLLTTCDVSEYLSSPITTHYLQNVTLYRMYYYLPGVFETNPLGGSINGSLWTLPYEFTCYLFLMLMGILGVLKKGIGALLILLVSVLSYFLFQEKLDTIVIPLIGIDFKHFYSFFLYFLSGTVFYLYRKLIPFNWIGLIVCVIIAVLIKTNCISGLLFVFVLPYLIFMLAFSKKIKMNRIGQYGDFSFGVYLYAFPIQQLIVYFFHKDIGVLSMIFLSFVFTAPFAIFSWKFIEKPALGLRKKMNLRIFSRRINTSDEATKP